MTRLTGTFIFSLFVLFIFHCNEAKEISLDASKPIGALLDLNLSLSNGNGGSSPPELTLEYDTSLSVGEGIVTEIPLNLTADPSTTITYDFAILSGPSSAVLQNTTISFPNANAIDLRIEVEPDLDCLDHELKIRATRQNDSETQEILLKVVDSDYCMFVAKNWSRKDSAAANPSGYDGNFLALHPGAPNGVTAADIECGVEKNFKYPEYPGSGSNYKAMLASESPYRSFLYNWWTFAANRSYSAKWEYGETWKHIFSTGADLPPINFSSQSFATSISDYGSSHWTGLMDNWHFSADYTCLSTVTHRSWESSEGGVTATKGQTTPTNSYAIYGIFGDCSSRANLICVQASK